MRSAKLAALSAALFLSACAAQNPTSGQCPLDGDTRLAPQAKDAPGQAAAPPASAALDAALHDYLLAHGDVVLQALQENQKRQQAARAEQAREAIVRDRAALLADPTDPVVGNPSAAVTVVEFFDAECPFCKREAPALKRLYAEDPSVRVVYKDFPILGPGSVAAAKAALAAMRQGRYEVFHDALMADATPEHQLSEPRILAIARSSGLDVARLRRDMAAPEIAAKIAANIDLARKLGITGTPGVIILGPGPNSGRLLPGAISLAALKTAVAEALHPEKVAVATNNNGGRTPPPPTAHNHTGSATPPNMAIVRLFSMPIHAAAYITYQGAPPTDIGLHDLVADTIYAPAYERDPPGTTSTDAVHFNRVFARHFMRAEPITPPSTGVH